jgi:hypothetical protein
MKGPRDWEHPVISSNRQICFIIHTGNPLVKFQCRSANRPRSGPSALAGRY